MKKLSHQGFTVLELLIVIAIMCILISLILVGLNSARTHSNDQNKVSMIETISVGLEQFHDVCRFYPASLTDTTVPSYSCPVLLAQGKTLANFIPDITADRFNDPTSEYVYSAFASTGDPTNTNCVAYHIGVKIDGPNSFTNQASNFDSSAHSTDLTTCPGAVSDTITSLNQSAFFDLYK